MLLRIRHPYRKAVIYGALMAIIILLAIWLDHAGVRREAIALLFLAIFLSGTAAYLLFDYFAIWLLRTKAADEASEPHLFRIVHHLSESMGLKTPRLAVINDSLPDVFVSGLAGNNPVIFVTEGLLTEFNDEELKVILRHELESIDEMGPFAYNIAMMAFSALLTASRFMGKSMLFKKRGVARDTHGSPPGIDKACTSDVPAVVRLLIANNMYSYVYLHDLVRLARVRSPLFLVARDGGKPVGLVIGEVNYGLFRQAVHITKIVIDENYRGKGIGSRLMRAFIPIFENIGNYRIEVRMNNRNAISLYEKFEFKKEKVVPGYYPDGTGCLIMVKSPAKKG